jgi:serine/threonine protein kinase
VSFSRSSPDHIGRYRIIRRLASGGLAEVYLGVREGPDGFVKPVAIKRLHSYFAENSSFINMLADEARVTARLDHPHIAQVLEFNYDEASGEGFLVYEFVPGRTLSQMLRQDDRGLKGGRGERFALSEPEAIAVTMGAARALHYAAERVDNRGEKLGVVHRDLSPPNIMVSFAGMVKVIDFGIAQAKHRIERTETGVVKGKFRYMSPEQLRGEELTHASDLYSLGVVLYELLAGDALYQADDDMALMGKVQRAERPTLLEALPDTSDELRILLDQLLERQSVDRVHSGAALAQRLQQLLINTHQVFDPEEPLHSLMERRFPGAGAAIEQELSLSEAPSEAEGVRRVRQISASREVGVGATATMVASPSDPFTSEATSQTWAEQPTLVSHTAEKTMEDDEGLLTDRIERPNAFPLALLMFPLFGLVALATFLGVKHFKRPEPAAVSPIKAPQKIPLSVACPGDAKIKLMAGDKLIAEDRCPFAEVLPLGLYSAHITRPGFESRQLQFNLKSPTRYPDQGTLPMVRIIGRLQLRVTPQAANPTFQIDNEPWLPGDVLLPGKHRLIVRSKEFVEQQHDLVIVGGETLSKTLSLQRPKTGTLRILPPKRGWFDILYKGKKLCSVPPPCERLTLPAGTQTLELRSVGAPQKRRVLIKANTLRVLDLSK